ncbi:NUDIX hydrolase [Hymenobacter sp. BT175]|uniref:NUDIX domain-containing protein n=1 Tax=Hymenobacter translucens TaxID=2886507 RepID=UPI001D0EBA85|nr:NUDIX hydrolase [Hymenobacter translucens]MCC2546313.1 NUDIX hydrolase [Hymenobacter translucens]
MKITQREIAYDGHYKLSRLIVRDGDEEYVRERFEPGWAVAALVFNTARQEYLFTRQYRVGPEKDLVEVAAGMIDGDEQPEEAIRREVLEELGFEVDHLELIAHSFPSPGTSSERISLFFAEVSQQRGKGGGLAEEGEHIEPVRFTYEQLREQKFEDAKTLATVFWELARRQSRS